MSWFVYKAPNQQIAKVADLAAKQQDLLRQALTVDWALDAEISDPTAKKMLEFIQDTNSAICSAMNHYRGLRSYLNAKAEADDWDTV